MIECKSGGHEGPSIAHSHTCVWGTGLLLDTRWPAFYDFLMHDYVIKIIQFVIEFHWLLLSAMDIRCAPPTRLHFLCMRLRGISAFLSRKKCPISLSQLILNSESADVVCWSARRPANRSGLAALWLKFIAEWLTHHFMQISLLSGNRSWEIRINGSVFIKWFNF